MDLNLKFLFLALLCLLYVSANPVKHADEMRFAGSADGKDFYALLAYQGSMNTWSQAGHACRAVNMTLAEITSPAQAQVIFESWQNGSIWCCTYWTGGRDALELRQFSWNSTGLDISQTGPELSFRPNMRTCLYLRVDTGLVEPSVCHNTSTRGYLCQEPSQRPRREITNLPLDDDNSNCPDPSLIPLTFNISSKTTVAETIPEMPTIAFEKAVEKQKFVDDMTYAGSADGKDFFAFWAPYPKDWFRAGESCLEVNMTLAEITSPAQVAAIQGSYQSGNVACCTYWSAGRDALEARQFSWNSTGIDVSQTGPALRFAPGLETCLYFRVDSGKLHPSLCAHTLPSRSYLCERKSES